MSICPRCGFQSAYEFQKCPNCLDPAIVLDDEADDPDAPIQLSRWEADPMTGCMTMTPFDNISEVGFPYGAVVLVSGPAGCGKSSWALRIAAAWGGPAMYFPYEQGIDQLRRSADLMELELERIWVCSPVASPFKFMRPRGLLIIDSLNDYASRYDGLVESCRSLTAHARATDNAMILLAHVTKEWEVAGPERLKHEVDVHIEIIPGMGHESKTKEPLQAVRCQQKNRFGPLWQRLVVSPWVVR